MKLLGSTKIKVTKNENIEYMHPIETTELVFLHWNFVNNDYQQDSKVLHTFVPNKSFSQWLDISPKKFIFLKNFNSKF